LKKQNNFFLCNLNNISKLDKILKKIKPDLIIHLAGESTVDNIKKAKKVLKFSSKFDFEDSVKNIIKNQIDD
jgi:GDP-D-mannose dehydratase